MDREITQGMQLGVMMIIAAATLLIGILIFWLGRTYTGVFFDDSAERQRNVEMAGLNGMTYMGLTEMPAASMYAVLLSEWRQVASVTVVNDDRDSNDTHELIASVIPGKERSWDVVVPTIYAPVNNSPNGLRPRGGDTPRITAVQGPEHALYAINEGIGPQIAQRITGRVFVMVTVDYAPKLSSTSTDGVTTNFTRVTTPAVVYGYTDGEGYKDDDRFEYRPGYNVFIVRMDSVEGDID